MRRLAEAGMGMARLNGSHNTLDWHRDTIGLLRDVLPDLPILLDIPGRKIRTLQLAVEPVFEKGAEIVLTTEPGHDGSEKIPVSYDALHSDLEAGNTILADDGTLCFTVTEIRGRDIHCRAETKGQLKSRKGINVPFVKLKNKMISERDEEMLAFARETGVDYVGISFVESAAHVEAIRAMIPANTPRIVAKVENQAGLDHLVEIVEATDAVMIDRGDLSVETSLDQVALFQKRILVVARQHGKPVIVATEMLHTMIENPFPTKAEVGDITNAVLDGCAATMLSGETAIGENAIEAVDIMRRVSDAAAAHMQDRMDEERGGTGNRTVPQAIEDAVALVCRSLPITKIVAITISGYAARMVAARQPRQPILAVSNDRAAARSFNLLPGTEGVFIDIPFPRNSTDHIVSCLEILWRDGRLSDDDLIMVTAVGYPRSGNRMNLLQTHAVADLIESLGWTR